MDKNPWFAWSDRDWIEGEKKGCWLGDIRLNKLSNI